MNKDLPRCCTVPVQVVPYEIQSINGSDDTMGCTSLLEGSGVNICERMSHLVDGCSPDIDTSTSDWASQLVTVRMNVTDDIPFTHVLLTFGFETAVSLTGIELDLFLCPEWKIGAPFITVIADEEGNLVPTNPRQSDLPLTFHISTQSSCSSLSNVSIPFRGNALEGQSFRTLHILASQFGPATDWVHVGEVRFFAANAAYMICTTMVSIATSNAPSKNISYQASIDN